MGFEVSEKADPNQPHAFVEKANVPFSVPKASVAGTTAMETPVRRLDTPPDCAVCEQPRTAPIHRAAEEAAAQEEHDWPK